MDEFDIASVGRKSVAGVLALMSRQLFLNIISLGVSLVIFTVLTPAEVGIYTAVIAVQRIISFFTDFGFGAALVQKKESLTPDDISTTFTLQLFITATIFLLSYFFAGTIVSYLNLPSSAVYLLLALVFSMFASSFKVIPSIILERKIEFQKLIIPQILESVLFNAILVVLVLKGFRLDSYTWAFIISSLVSIPFYYMVSPWRVKIGIYKTSLVHLKFGLQFQAKNILATIKDDLLTVFLVKLLTLPQLGYIGFAQRMSFFAYRYIVDSVTKVTFSAYSRMQEDKVLLRKGIEKSLFFVSLIMFPTMAAIIILGPKFIQFIPQWQNKWNPAVVSLIFFSLNAAMSSLSGILVNVLDSGGKVKTTLNLMVLWTLLTWFLTPLFIFFWGYNGVAAASFVITLTIILTIHLAKKVVEFSFITSIYKPLIGTIVMSIFLYVISNIFATGIVLLIGFGLLSGGLYMVILYMTAGKELQEDLSKIIFRKT
jgi:O-antigen/teichoic acid export membrane protein